VKGVCLMRIFVRDLNFYVVVLCTIVSWGTIAFCQNSIVDYFIVNHCCSKILKIQQFASWLLKLKFYLLNVLTVLMDHLHVKM
jgi:hypothetical protein